VTLRETVGIELHASGSRELVFAHNAFMAVQLAFHAILENARHFGQLAYDREASASRNFLVTVG
jgi:hypothetical protein